MRAIGILFIISLVFVSGCTGQDGKAICPPAGLPQPPGCTGASSSVNGVPAQPYSITFTAAVPDNTPVNTIVYVQIINASSEWARSLQMQKVSGNVWHVVADLKAFAGSEISYRYMRNGWGFTGAEEFTPDSKSAARNILVEKSPKAVNDTVAKWRWLSSNGAIPTIQTNAGKIAFASRVGNEVYQKGAVMVDFWWNNFYLLLASTHERLKEGGFKWIEIEPGWDYTQVDPPVIAATSYDDNALNFQLKKMKDDGFKVFLSSQICCTVTDKASFSDAWWAEWFSEYEKYALYFAGKAKEYNVDELVITGDWIATDKKPLGYREKLEAIYSKVKSVYSGKLGRLVFLGGAIDKSIPSVWPNTDDIPFMDKADFIAVNWWVGLTTTNNPTQDELNAKAKEIFGARLKTLYDKYQKPIILQQVAYPSVDGGLSGNVGVFDPGILLWEQYSDKYTLDMAEQAMGYEAVMNAVAEAPYVIGIYPFTYWPDDFPLSKEHNIRGKTAEEVLKQWFKVI